MPSRFTLWWALGLSALLVHACGGKVDDAPESCEPGSVKACGGSGIAGPCYRQCLPSGDGYSACECSPSGGGGLPPGGYGGAPTGGGGYPVGGGGYPFGGSGGYPSGGSGGMPCGDCPGYKLGGLIDMKPCCALVGSCGGLVDNTIASLLGMSPGCYATNQPGPLDPSCPTFDYQNPLDGGPATFPGCCQANTGTCGVLIDATWANGPYFGCTDVGAGGGGPQKCGGYTGNCDLCVQAKCAAELSKCTQAPSCKAILTCASVCTEQACMDKCISAYPSGQPMFYAFINCVSQQCAADCQ